MHLGSPYFNLFSAKRSLLLVGLGLCLSIADAQVVINEVHFDAEPKTEYVEFIELKNTGATAVDLSGWSFSDGVGMTFPSSASIPAGGYLLLAEDTAALAVKFSSIPAGTSVYQYSGSLSNDGEKLVLRDAATIVVDSVDYGVGFPWPVSPAGEGDSMQLINVAVDNDLGGAWRGAVPSPGQANIVAVMNTPPMIRQVSHFPLTPNSSQLTTITAKVTDSDGLTQVNLLVQVVVPGAYIPAYLPRNYSTLTGAPNSPMADNPAFEDPANWSSITMVDDGTLGDAVAGDDIFTGQVPAQNHRTLVRYRISAEDTLTESVRVPYADDESKNFAYFVYDGLPAFTATSASVHPDGAGYVHPTSVVESLPVYTMITRDADRKYAYAYSSTGDGNLQISVGNVAARQTYNWECAFVYDGVVYDHVLWRLRQRNDRYSGNGKRSMRYRFNRGHYFQARDENGNLLPVKWRRLNTSKMSRFSGENTYGLEQMISSTLWRMVGVECPRVFPVHFRMIDGADEAPDQYGGDFFGLATIVQDIDGNLLDERGLSNGNMYKLKDGTTNPQDLQRNQTRSAVTDASDFLNIKNNLNASQSDAWLTDHVNWDQWTRYHTVCEAIRHYDFGVGSGHQKNRAWYFQPKTGTPYGVLRLIPHDYDATWIKGYHDTLNSTGNAVGTGFPWRAIFGGITRPAPGPFKTAFTVPYQNFVREFRDILWQPETINSLINQRADQLRAFSLADRDRWVGAPSAAGNETMGPIDDITNSMKDFAFVSDTVYGSDLVGGRGAFLEQISDDEMIPNTPVISYIGAAGFPSGDLMFSSSAYSVPSGGVAFQAMQWRIGRNGGLPHVWVSSGDLFKYFDAGTDPGSDWNLDSTIYDDSAWSEGATQIGKDESDEATIIPNSHITTYFRKTINIPDVTLYGEFAAGIVRDDGAIVYVNGVEVWRDQMPDGEVTYTTLASEAASGSNEKVFHAFTIPVSNFQNGDNIIAIEVHQGAVNSDLSFDFTLEGLPPANAEVYYEWESSWESGDLTPFDISPQIPAAATRTGGRYRARVRHQDSAGRWSHWSDPYEFTAAAPAVTAFSNALVVSEMMYNPAPPTAPEIAAGFDDADDFEFLEIRNVSDQAIDLSNVRLTKGVDFDFSAGTITSLAPGGYVLVVEDSSAFAMRHGSGLPVAGEWSGKLANGGEQVKLSFGAGETIRDFTYDDLPNWPTSPDGSGPSLVLVDPNSLPDHNDPLNWRASVAIGGNAGSTDGTTFTGGSDAELLDYAGGARSAIFHPDGNITFTIEINRLAEDVIGELQYSTNLSDWFSADILVPRTAYEVLSNSQGRATFTTLTPPDEDRWFLRYKVQLRE